jgi:hypothetical protein
MKEVNTVYKLKKDLPWIEAGELFLLNPDKEWFSPESNEFMNNIHNLIHKDWVIGNETWFEPVVRFSPLVGEWVFNEITKTAMKIVEHDDMKSAHVNIHENFCLRLIHNECSPEAVKDNPQTYLRYPTDVEVAISVMDNYLIKSLSGNLQVLKIATNGSIYNKNDSKYYGNINDIHRALVGDIWDKMKVAPGARGTQGIKARTFQVGCQEYKISQLEDIMTEIINYNTCVIEENKKKK